ncbi:hypothetical protein NEMBOFW57_000502 [Staphylotrichum longicolle]|uniref:Proteophosphoglycan 5 n=1 Tax=Staphylotrichum longicolle TaxID=669026 RepID=A0AAD4F006_9PEZI|nr:hypothetical protein NEMBOFW57_000502 [Staphylotrichum longicolle]
MEQQQPPSLPPNKSTPARRRAKRPINSPARKTYASENDMPSEAVFPIELAGPFTPQKSASHSPAPGSQPNQAKSKPRNGNKALAKTCLIARTSKASFLSKALDSPSVQETDHASREPSPPATDSEAPTPQQRLLRGEVPRQDSPLDIFFRADRAEKERARRASSANILGPNPVPFSPPNQIRSPAEPKTLPGGLFGAGSRRPPFQRNPSSGIPTSELDGTPDDVVGPAFSKPYHDRIRAARSNNKQAEPAQKSPPPPQQDQGALDMSERLKRFLAIPPLEGGQQQQQGPTVSPPGYADTPLQYTSRDPTPRQSDLQPAFSSAPRPTGTPNAPSPFAPGPRPMAVPNAQSPFYAGGHPILAPSAPRNPDNSRSPEILHMEDSLRRMLKLNLGSAPASAAPTNYQSS